MANYLTRRGSFWRFCRRVPDEYRTLDRRDIVQQSTKVRIVDDPRGIRAREVAQQMNAALETFWRDLANAPTAQAVADYDAATKAAKRMNISPPDASAQRTIAELVARIEQLEKQLEKGNKIEDKANVLAVYDLVSKPVMTFKQCAEQYIEAHKGSWSSSRHAAKWQSTLAQYVYPVLGDVPIADITNSKGTDLIMQIVNPIWTKKTETASKVRGRTESVIDWATARGYRKGANPARWRGHLEKLLPAKSKVSPIEHHTALPYAKVPSFMQRLRSINGTAAHALQFMILTASRISEALEAQHSEIDREAKMWIVPAARMKTRKEHRVPLSDAVLAIIDAAPVKGYFLFPRSHDNKPISEASIRRLYKRLGVSGQITSHGFRSTFKDWAAETTNYPNEVSEMALAHTVSNAVEAAYRRGDLLAKRKNQMQDWADYCNQK
jgi:integrase